MFLSVLFLLPFQTCIRELHPTCSFGFFTRGRHEAALRIIVAHNCPTMFYSHGFVYLLVCSSLLLRTPWYVRVADGCLEPCCASGIRVSGAAADDPIPPRAVDLPRLAVRSALEPPDAGSSPKQ